jgi:fibronectin-binding autotransporter adhesin
MAAKPGIASGITRRGRGAPSCSLRSDRGRYAMVTMASRFPKRAAQMDLFRDGVLDRTYIRPRSERTGRARWMAGAGAAICAASLASPALAQDGQWRSNAPSGDWNSGGNWNPATVPSGTATFDSSTQTNITVASNTSIGTLHFNSGAPQYTINVQTPGTVFTINGAGIVNDSASRPRFIIQQVTFDAPGAHASVVDFTNGSSAGNASIQVGSIIFDLKGAGLLNFRGNSNAADALIAITGSGQATFFDHTSATNANITNEGDLIFADSSQAADASITNYNTMFIKGNATLADATIENSNGLLEFAGQADAGRATITSDPGAFRVTAGFTIDLTKPFFPLASNLYQLAQVFFGDSTTAGQANLINNAGNGTYVPDDPAVIGCSNCVTDVQNGGMAIFAGNSNAGSSHITNNGGTNGSFFHVNYFDYIDPVDPALNQLHLLILAGNNAALALFGENSTAASSTIVNTDGAWTTFFGNSTAATSTITANSGATIWLREQSTGASATLIANNGGTIGLFDTATAGAATVTGNSGAAVYFNDRSSGGTARFINNGGALIDISQLTAAGTQIGSIEGGGNLFLGSRALTVGGNNLSTTIGGVIANGGVGGGTGGSLIKTGTGTLTLTGASTYTGATTISQGMLVVTGSLASTTLQVGSGTTLGGNGTIAGTVAVANGGIVAPGMSPGTLTVGGLVLNSGSILNYELGPPGVIGGGVNDLIIVTGNLTLDGTLNVSNAGGFGNGVYRLINYGGTLTDNGLLPGSVPFATGYLIQAGGGFVNLIVGGTGPTQFWDGTDTTPDGIVNGGNGIWTAATTNWTDPTGAVNGAWGSQFAVFAGAAGTVTVAGPIDFTGMQFLTGGYHIVPGAGAALNIAGAQATIRVDARATAEIAAPIAGSGGLLKNDPGTLILSGANSYGGGTQIVAGTLQLGAGGTSGSVAGNIQNAGALVFNRSDSYDFTGAISGAGMVNQAGTGTLRFGGAQTYSGATSVSAGTLQADGSLLSSALNVGVNGTLTGTGTVGTTTVAGRIAPAGSGAGTLNVAGNYLQQAGSIYAVTLPAAGAADLIRITGTATLQGGTVQVANSGTLFHLGARATILTATGGRAGTFAGASLATPLSQPFLSFGLGYTANDAFLQVQRNAVPFASAGGTLNEIDAATGVEGLVQTSPLYIAIAESPDLASARAAFDLVSGEIHATARGVLLDESRYVREAALARTAGAGAAGTSIWGHATGAWGHADGGAPGGAAPIDRKAQAILIGLDTGLGGWRAGAIGGYSHSRIDADARASTANVDSYHVAAYVGGRWGGTALRLGGAYAWHNFDTRRTISFSGFSDSERGNYDGRAFQLFGEIAQRFDLRQLRVEPFGALAHVRLSTGAFTETGGAAALSGRKESEETSFSSLGLRGSVGLGALGTGASLRASAAWRHAFGDTVPTALLAFGSGTPFTIYGAPIARDAIALEAGLEAHLAGGAMLTIVYSGQLAGATQDHTAQARLSVAF